MEYDIEYVMEYDGMLRVKRPVVTPWACVWTWRSQHATADRHMGKTSKQRNGAALEIRLSQKNLKGISFFGCVKRTKKRRLRTKNQQLDHSSKLCVLTCGSFAVIFQGWDHFTRYGMVRLRNPAPVDRWSTSIIYRVEQPSFWWCRISLAHPLAMKDYETAI